MLSIFVYLFYLQEQEENEDEEELNSREENAEEEESFTSASNNADIDELDLQSKNKRADTPTKTGPKKSKKRKIEEDVQENMAEALKILKTTLNSDANSTNNKKDRLQLFTDLLYVKLKSMDDFNQEVAMHEIDNIMFRLKHPQLRRFYEVQITGFKKALNINTDLFFRVRVPCKVTIMQTLLKFGHPYLIQITLHSSSNFIQ